MHVYFNKSEFHVQIGSHMFQPFGGLEFKEAQHVLDRQVPERLDCEVDGVPVSQTAPTTVYVGAVARTTEQLSAAPTEADISLTDGAVFYDSLDPTRRYTMNADHSAFVAMGSGVPALFVSRELTPRDSGGLHVCMNGYTEETQPERASIPMGLPLGFSCSFRGPVIVDGPVTIRDMRSAGAEVPWGTLIGVDWDTYDLLGSTL